MELTDEASDTLGVASQSVSEIPAGGVVNAGGLCLS